MTIARALAAACLLAAPAALIADSNVADPKKHTWGENIGWINWRDANGSTQGVEVYRFSHLAGYAWSENCGWINLGDGNAPYANTDGTNFGVNIDPGTGEMSGFAWAENLGWINFGPFPPATTAPAPAWDQVNHRSTGYAWSENAGWINLEDAIRYVCSVPGDVNSDGTVDVFDFSDLAAGFGSVGNAPFANGDVNGDGVVDVFDFSDLAGSFGVGCP
jgi:hypothetical protein